MILSECICITYDNSNELTEIDRVLNVTKSVLGVTAPMPTLTWSTNDNHVFIFANSNELSILKIVLQNTLGLFNEAPSDTPNFSDPQHRYAVPRLSTDVNAVGLREVSADVGVPTTFVGRIEDTIGDIPFDTSFDCEPPTEVEPSYSDGDMHPRNLSRSDLSGCISASPLTDDGEPNLIARSNMAGAERTFATVWNGASVLDDSDQARWQLVNDRLNEEPHPTESASGSYTAEEQIMFSEQQNPRHWNLVKCSYNGSRYYLSYICPPTVNVFDTLRIVGGIHADDTPEIREICAYNSEPYWRELRHMMHQGVTSLREAVAA